MGFPMPGSGTLIKQVKTAGLQDPEARVLGAHLAHQTWVSLESVQVQQQLEHLMEMDLGDVQMMVGGKGALVELSFSSCAEMKVVLVVGIVIRVVPGVVEVKVKVMEWDVKELLSEELLGIKGHKIEKVGEVKEWYLSLWR
ncbi:hypothetical protein ACLOJK_038819 [Asimina triloba]